MSRSAAARSRAAVLLAAGAALITGGLAGLAPHQAAASSHREAPLISGQPQYDNTDVYAFVSPDKPDTTTLVANWLPALTPVAPNDDQAGAAAIETIGCDMAPELNLQLLTSNCA